MVGGCPSLYTGVAIEDEVARMPPNLYTDCVWKGHACPGGICIYIERVTPTPGAHMCFKHRGRP